MTTINAEFLDDVGQPRSPRLATLLAQWPVLSCTFLALAFMLATNDPNATTSWQEISRNQGSQLAITLESGRATRQLAFMLMGLWGAIMLVLPGRPWRFSAAYVFPILVFIAWACASILWSVDRSFTFRRVVVFACVTTAVFGFVRRFRVRDLALLALVGGIVQLSASVVADIVNAGPLIARSGYRFSGLQHPNHSGISAVLLAFAAIYFFDRTKLRRFLVVLAAAVVLLLLSKSRSSLFAGVAGAMLFGALRWRPRTLVMLGLAGGLAFSLLFTLEASGIVPDDWYRIIHMGRTDAQQTALTGRPQIWAAAIEVFGDDYTRLLTGVGYDSFWTPAVARYVSARVWFGISEGHNGYLDLLFELGVVGVGCFTFLLLASLIRWTLLARRAERGAYAFCAMMLGFTAVHCMTESTMVDPNFATFFMCAAIVFLAMRNPKMPTAEVA